MTTPPWQGPCGSPPGILSKKFGTASYFSVSAKAETDRKERTTRSDRVRRFIRGEAGGYAIQPRKARGNRPFRCTRARFPSGHLFYHISPFFPVGYSRAWLISPVTCPL